MRRAKKKTDEWYYEKFQEIRRSQGGNKAYGFYRQMPMGVKERLRGRLLVVEVLRRSLTSTLEKES